MRKKHAPVSQRELLQLLHAPLADTLLVAEGLNVAEFGMYYKSPEIAPLAQPANPLEATTGEVLNGHRRAGGCPSGGCRARSGGRLAGGRQHCPRVSAPLCFT